MESSYSTNGNTFQGMGITVGETRTPTCPATLDYSSLSLYKDLESRTDPYSDLLFNSEGSRRTDREYLSSVSPNVSLL